jgi:hypothetical protein
MQCLHEAAMRICLQSAYSIFESTLRISKKFGVEFLQGAVHDFHFDLYQSNLTLYLKFS